jgi:hypothetical protein
MPDPSKPPNPQPPNSSGEKSDPSTQLLESPQVRKLAEEEARKSQMVSDAFMNAIEPPKNRTKKPSKTISDLNAAVENEPITHKPFPSLPELDSGFVNSIPIFASQQSDQHSSHRVSRVLAGGLFALSFGSLIQSLTVFGVITMNSGHLFMAVAFIAGAFLLTTEILPLKPTRHKVVSVIILGVVLLVIDVAAAFYAASHEQKGKATDGLTLPQSTPLPSQPASPSSSSLPSVSPSPLAAPSLSAKPPKRRTEATEQRREQQRIDRDLMYRKPERPKNDNKTK